MADKRIQDLTPATSVQTSDRFVLEQAGQAKSLTGQILINDLATALDGHGGVSNISYTPPTSPSLSGTMEITMVDETVFTVSVMNGRGITGITWSTSGTPGDGLMHTGTFSYNDGTTSTVQIRDGFKGNTGAQTYVWFKWAEVYPSSNEDMQNNAGPYIGIYSGTSSTAPTSYTSYTWYEYKGEKGDTGSSIESISLTSSSGLVDTYTVLLTDGNTSTFTVTNAKSIVSIVLTSGNHSAGSTDVYTITFNDGDTATFSVYNGANGLGSVSTVSGIQADGTGDVPQVISGNGPPTTATIGQINQLYFDVTNSILYYCTGESGGTYVWQGSGVTVDSALSGSSTNPVQNSVITNRVGTQTLPNNLTNLSGAINYVYGQIPTAATTTPLADYSTATIGSATKWAKADHRHPLNVSSALPTALGPASAGSASTYSRTDHRHPVPTLQAVNAASTTKLIDIVYPVGSIFLSTNSANPATYMGGEWVQIEDVFLLAAGSTYTAGDTGGEATHTLTTDEIPAHTHTVPYNLETWRGSSGNIRNPVTNGSGGTVTSNSAGGGQAHNNMPPYLVVYAWERTL